MKSFACYRYLKTTSLLIAVIMLSALLVITPNQKAPANPDNVSWSFTNPGNYTVSDPGKVDISGGQAMLRAVDQTDDDDSPTGFGGGTGNNTQWDLTNDWLELDAAGQMAGSGDFTSRVMDATISTSWDSITWMPQRPLYKELPDNGGVESGYPEGNADMTGNVLLMHMNEESGLIVDYSGEGNDGTAQGGVTYGVDGILKTALGFNGIDGVIIGPSSNDITGDNLQTITYSAWVKHTHAGDNGYISSLKRSAAYSTLISLDAGSGGPGNLGFLTRTHDDSTHVWLNYDGGYNDGEWHHLVAVVDGLERILYIDGVERNSDNHGIASVSGNTAPFSVGGMGAGNLLFNGSIDEVAIWNRSLSPTEVADVYKRGALRLEYQVRSDNTNPPTTGFIGPDGTNSTYYSELQNDTLSSPSLPLTNVVDNQYFQYRAYLETDDPACSPELKSATIGPIHYPGDNPTIINNNPPAFSILNSFTETPGAGNQGSIRYQISNNGTNYYWWDGSNWSAAAGYSQTNTAAEVSANCHQFDDDVGPGNFHFKAFLHSDGTQRVELDELALEYDDFPAPTVTGIDPDHGDRGQTLDDVSITGSDFRDVAITVRLSRGADVIPATDVKWVSAGEITCDLDLSGATVADDWDVYVRHDDDGKSDTMAGAFSVQWRPPDVTGIDPDHGNRGQSLDDVSITGGDFRNVSTTIRLQRDAWEIDGTDVTWKSDTEITCDFDLAGATVGDGWDLYVRHDDDGKSDTLTGAFSVEKHKQPPPACNWYFAEGYTGNGHYPGEAFDTWFMLQNIEDEPAEVRATFMTLNGEVIEKEQVVEPHSRYTLHANEVPGLEDTQMSTRFTSTNGVPFVAERAMYFDYCGLKGGHATVGVNNPSDTWYLAEGFVLSGEENSDRFDTFILIQNPEDNPAEILVEFMAEDGILFRDYTVPPHSRMTVMPGDIESLDGTSFSTTITSVNGVKVVAERSMYFDYKGRKGGHASRGTNSAASRWFLAEGYTSDSFDTYILIQNPEDRSVDVELLLMNPEGWTRRTSVNIPAHSRSTVYVNELEGLSSAEVSAIVEAEQGRGIVVERAMYFDFKGRKGGHCSVGASSASRWISGEDEGLQSSWCMAEGFTGGNFDTFILIQNPNLRTADVRVEFMLPQGEPSVHTLQLQPYSRHTIHVDELEGLFSTPVSTRVESTNGVSIVAERSTYFVYYDDIGGGHDSIGYPR